MTRPEPTRLACLDSPSDDLLDRRARPPLIPTRPSQRLVRVRIEERHHRSLRARGLATSSAMSPTGPAQTAPFRAERQPRRRRVPLATDTLCGRVGHLGAWSSGASVTRTEGCGARAGGYCWGIRAARPCRVRAARWSLAEGSDSAARRRRRMAFGLTLLRRCYRGRSRTATAGDSASEVTQRAIVVRRIALGVTNHERRARADEALTSWPSLSGLF